MSLGAQASANSAFAPGLLAAAEAAIAFSITAYNGSAGTLYLLLFDAAAVPLDGAVPLLIKPIFAGQTDGFEFGNGRPCRNGIYACLSNTPAAKLLTAGSPVQIDLAYSLNPASVVAPVDCRVTTADRLLRGVMQLWTGQNVLPGVADFPTVRDHLDLALKEAWRSEWWPDLMQREERYFRDSWSLTTTYDATDEVYDPYSQKYFQSLRDDSLNQAPTTLSGSSYVENNAYWAESRATYSGSTWLTGTVYAVGDKVRSPVTNRYYQCHTAHTSSAVITPASDSYWGLLTPFARSISFDATGQTKIGDVFDVKDSDPRINLRWRALSFDVAENKLWVTEEVVRCWVEFRARLPRLKGADYDEDTIYYAGDQFYYATDTRPGDFWDVLSTTEPGDTPDSDPDLFTQALLPEAFEGYLIWSAYAKTLTGDQQDDRKAMAEATAEGYLQLEADAIFRQQGATPNVSMRTY